MKTKMTQDIRDEVAMRIKNRIDIADIINGYAIDNEDLSGAIITKFDRDGENISNLILTNAIIGTETGETNLNRVIGVGCNFKGTRFLGKVNARKANLSRSNFSNAYIPYCDYRFADVRGCTFCGTIFTIASTYSYGAKFSPEFFSELGKHFNLEIKVKEEVK